MWPIPNANIPCSGVPHTFNFVLEESWLLITFAATNAEIKEPYKAR